MQDDSPKNHTPTPAPNPQTPHSQPHRTRPYGFSSTTTARIRVQVQTRLGRVFFEVEAIAGEERERADEDVGAFSASAP